jgi:succinate dehydrogenase / fumarate reductase cytochrome b subunit
MADMERNGRPLSPHLQVYRWQMSMFSSILNRITGNALIAGGC